MLNRFPLAMRAPCCIALLALLCALTVLSTMVCNYSAAELIQRVKPSFEYAVVCDAGSSGTRMHVFHVPDRGRISEVGQRNVEPGLASFAQEPFRSTKAAEYLRPLFDYAAQARLWIPRDLPQPNDPQHSVQVAQLAASLSGVTEGGVLVLCTSHRALRDISDRLRRQASQRVLRQGDAGKAELLAEFAADGHAILVATQSFWEGVDVRGRALRVVMIDRMPFAPPGDPVADARALALRARGEHPFRAMALPEAILQLRQGAGRLIRDPADRGLLVICDPRLQTQSYGRLVRKSLPPMPECANEAEALAWAQQL